MAARIIWAVNMPVKKITGGETYFNELCCCLSREYSGLMVTELFQKPVRRISIFTSLLLLFNRNIRRGDIVIEELFGSNNYIILNLLLKFLKKARIIMNVHAYIRPDSIVNRIKMFIFSIQLRICDVIVANSNYTKEWLKGLGIHESRIRIIHPVIQSRFAEMSPLNTMDRGQREASRILCVSNIHPDKGQYDLVSAFISLGNKDIGLKLVGATKDAQYLRKINDLIEVKGKGFRVEHNKYVELPELVDHFRSSDIFVFPSKREGFGLVLLEAMYAGLPSIAYDSGGMKDFAEDGVNSIFIEKGDIKNLASALKRLIEDPSMRETISRNAFASSRDFIRSRNGVTEYVQMIQEMMRT